MTKPAGFYHIGEQALGAALYMNRTVPSIPPSLPRNLDPISTYRSFKTSSASTDLFSLSFQTAAFLGGSVEAPLITSNLIFVPEPIKTHHSFGNTFLFFSVSTRWIPSTLSMAFTSVIRVELIFLLGELKAWPWALSLLSLPQLLWVFGSSLDLNFYEP